MEVYVMLLNSRLIQQDANFQSNMAGTGLWVKGRSSELSQSSDIEDVWDDTALIEAYDKAVNSFKNSLKDKSKSESSQSKRQKGHKNHHKKKSKSHINSKWKVGDKCQAVYHEDGLIYGGEIIDIQDEDKTYTIRFDYYENEEVVPFEDIFEKHQNELNLNGNKRKSESHGKYKMKDNVSRSMTKSMEMGADNNEIADNVNENLQYDHHNAPPASWAIGDMCLAPNPQTGIYEEAVLTSVESDSCILTFIQTNTKERLNMASLRPRGSKKSVSRHTCKRHNKDWGFPKCDENWRPDFPDQDFSLSDFMSQVPPIPPYFDTPSPDHQYPDYHGRYRRNGAIAPPPPPPPPPIGLPIDGEEESEHALASMLMSWYMVGYHTGYYQGIRSKSSTQRASKQRGRTDPMDMLSDSSSKPDI